MDDAECSGHVIILCCLREAYDLSPLCAKCEVWSLTDSNENHFALMLAVLENAWRMGHEIRGQHVDSKMERGQASHLPQFIEEVSPQIWPERERPKKISIELDGAMKMVAKLHNDIG